MAPGVRNGTPGRSACGTLCDWAKWIDSSSRSPARLDLVRISLARIFRGRAPGTPACRFHLQPAVRNRPASAKTTARQAMLDRPCQGALGML